MCNSTQHTFSKFCYQSYGCFLFSCHSSWSSSINRRDCDRLVKIWIILFTSGVFRTFFIGGEGVGLFFKKFRKFCRPFFRSNIFTFFRFFSIRTFLFCKTNFCATGKFYRKNQVKKCVFSNFMENFDQKNCVFAARAPPSKLFILAPKAS